MIVLAASLVAALGLLLPVLLFVVLRSVREREPWQVALDVPTALSLDLLVVLSLTWLLPLEKAAIASRAVYVIVAAIVARRRRLRPRRPRAIGGGELACVALATLVGLALSLWLSRQWVIWDRGWHIPLVGSLGGQRLPFHNVFDARQVLHYHFAADVQAAVLQALSFGVLHASLALSLLHDILFSLTGLTLALFMVAWGYRRLGVFALGAAALLLTGPVHVFREGIRTPQEGLSIVSFLSFSFQPHKGLSALLTLGFVGALAARLGGRDDLPWRKTAPALVACAAAMAITDETSLGLLGLTVGLVWICAPRVLHERRVVGVLVLLALAAALVLPNLAFCASLGPGAGRHVLKLVPWRIPGYTNASLPLATPRGRLMFAYDMLAPAAVGLGVLVLVVARRGRGRGGLTLCYLTLLTLSMLAFTRVDVDGQSAEIHRFVSAVFITGPFVTLALLAPGFAGRGRSRAGALYGAFIMAMGLAAAALSTLDWIIAYAPSWASRPAGYGKYDLYAVSCREMLGDRRGRRTRPTYLSKSLYYLAAGCTPTYTPGYASDSAWKTLTIGLPYEGYAAIAALRKDPPADIPLLCPVEIDPTDKVCALAESSGACTRAGLVAKDCSLTAAQAAKLPPK
jgi:hypothetical protein